MRLEDLDRARVVPGASEAILADLAWLGIDWDEGPDRGGPYAPYVQSQRTALYDAAFERLKSAGRVYPCFCSRKDVAAAASAPQAPGDEIVYPGTCRDLPDEEVAKHLASGKPAAWRFRASPRTTSAFHDLVRGSVQPEPASYGDFVVRRADGVPAYQLAVVVDDAAMRIDEVVRGGDLLPSTWRQFDLYRALGASPPAFGHVPLLLGADGVRLSKRHRGVTLAELRDDGWSASAIVGRLARALGLRPTDGPLDARALLPGFGLERLREVPPEIAIE
jgi:glutamyl-tRNA synthetase